MLYNVAEDLARLRGSLLLLIGRIVSLAPVKSSIKIEASFVVPQKKKSTRKKSGCSAETPGYGERREFNLVLHLFNLIKVVQRFEVDFLEKDVTADPIRKEDFSLIRYMSRCWDSEHIIKFFERTLFRFCVKE